MRLRVVCKTDVGLKREHNEDSFLYDEELGLFCVADGMGGHRGGEVASSLAVRAVIDSVKETRQRTLSDGAPQNRMINTREVIARAYERASSSIYRRSQVENPELAGMGTTLVVALRSGSSLFIGNVGDSRAYLYSRKQLWQLTEDHSLINEQLRAGLINEEDLPRITHKNVITRSVGFESHVQVDILERELVAGDYYLLCSDGLSGLVSDVRLQQIIEQHGFNDIGALNGIVTDAIEEAKANGGDDNITALGLYVAARP